MTINLNLNSQQDTVGAGKDTFKYIEDIEGTAFDDTLTGNGSANRLAGNSGKDIVEGGAGNDTLSYAGSLAGVTVNLLTGLAQGGDAEGDSFGGFERLTGSAFGDKLVGDGGANKRTASTAPTN